MNAVSLPTPFIALLCQPHEFSNSLAWVAEEYQTKGQWQYTAVQLSVHHEITKRTCEIAKPDRLPSQYMSGI